MKFKAFIKTSRIHRFINMASVMIKNNTQRISILGNLELLNVLLASTVNKRDMLGRICLQGCNIGTNPLGSLLRKRSLQQPIYKSGLPRFGVPNDA